MFHSDVIILIAIHLSAVKGIVFASKTRSLNYQKTLK